MAAKAKSKKAGAAGGGSRTIVAPSILSADIGALEREIKAVDKAGADWIHVDVMDGRFVPNITWGPPIVEAARRATDKPLDVHLMIVEPERHIDAFARAGADIITVHAEACPHLHRAVQQIREAGKALKPSRDIKVGVSVNPATSLAALDYILPELDMALIMSVNPGWGGQKFIPQCFEKIADLRYLAEDMELEIDIQVDGGVGPSNIASVAAMGANSFVAGSAIFNTSDYKKAIAEMRAGALEGAGRPRGG